ncbi:MAG: helix-turn-helix domain-containing protein [Fimbriimonadaceae bacterium]|nr:helix-turn-helix domain-containing protein [Fimbriimonadaceae bacterium]
MLKSFPAQVLGDRLRRARVRQSISVRDLAKAAAVSKNSITRLEHGGGTNPATLVKVCAALGLHVAGLLRKEQQSEQIVVVHRKQDDRWFDMTDFGAGPLGGLDRPISSEERAAFVAAGAQVPLLMLTNRLESGRLLPAILELHSQSELRSHAGEEMVYVLAGSIVLKVGEQEVILHEGECATFWSAEQHAYAPAPGSPLPARVLSIRSDDRPG